MPMKGSAVVSWVLSCCLSLVLVSFWSSSIGNGCYGWELVSQFNISGGWGNYTYTIVDSKYNAAKNVLYLINGVYGDKYSIMLEAHFLVYDIDNMLLINNITIPISPDSGDVPYCLRLLDPDTAFMLWYPYWVPSEAGREQNQKDKRGTTGYPINMVFFDLNTFKPIKTVHLKDLGISIGTQDNLCGQYSRPLQTIFYSQQPRHSRNYYLQPFYLTNYTLGEPFIVPGYPNSGLVVPEDSNMLYYLATVPSPDYKGQFTAFNLASRQVTAQGKINNLFLLLRGGLPWQTVQGDPNHAVWYYSPNGYLSGGAGLVVLDLQTLELPFMELIEFPSDNGDLGTRPLHQAQNGTHSYLLTGSGWFTHFAVRWAFQYESGQQKTNPEFISFPPQLDGPTMLIAIKDYVLAIENLQSPQTIIKMQ